jgi:hypothetical protein
MKKLPDLIAVFLLIGLAGTAAVIAVAIAWIVIDIVPIIWRTL